MSMKCKRCVADAGGGTNLPNHARGAAYSSVELASEPGSGGGGVNGASGGGHIDIAAGQVCTNGTVCMVPSAWYRSTVPYPR